MTEALIWFVLAAVYSIGVMASIVGVRRDIERASEMQAATGTYSPAMTRVAANLVLLGFGIGWPVLMIWFAIRNWARDVR